MLVNDNMANKSNNKEKIFDVSIDLFSEYGYDGVSIRQIAKEVGIKESSIYNHYKSKESIMDAILDYYIGRMMSNDIPVSQASENLDVGFDYFYESGLDAFASQLKDEKMYFQQDDGSFQPAESLRDNPDIRWYLETDNYGALEYWLPLEYVAQCGGRLMQAK